jgi:putative cardiolipin synthase
MRIAEHISGSDQHGLIWGYRFAAGRPHLHLVLLVAVALLAGCASLPRDVERTPSTAFDRPLETTIGRYFAPSVDAHPGQSGFRVVRQSREAFTVRVGLADMAERSLDLQYYIWEDDTTGKVLIAKILAAANRGVRVRILLDDNNFQGRDFGLAAIDEHPNVEIRVFNPFANRGMHALDFMTSFGRVNRRMHNKVMIADAAVAVIGGRNIGDHYFGVNTDANFRDLDLAMAGPIVSEAAQTFDRYWNSELSYPIGKLHEHAYTQAEFAALSTDVRKELAEHPYPYPIDQDVAAVLSEIDRIRAELMWASGRVVADDPMLLDAGERVTKDTLVKWLNGTQRELLIESAYFVPLESGVAGLAGAVEKGIKVRVLTNSLASNDVAAAHAGYEKYRKQLLESGVEVYELRPDAGKVRKEWSVMGGRSIAALHTKALVVDRRSTFVGSFNLDPRSANINTEVGLLVDSPELAAEVAGYLDEGVEPDNAYRVTLDERGRTRWATTVDGKETTFDHEPHTSVWKRFSADVVRVLPVESQL